MNRAFQRYLKEQGLSPHGYRRRIQPERFDSPRLIIAKLREWERTHDKPPRRKDWSWTLDPECRWPRSSRVDMVFSEFAHWIWPCLGDTDENGWHGCGGWGAPDICRNCALRPGAWQLALYFAGLEPWGTRHWMPTPSLMRGHGRNRQMVTAGKPHASTIGTGTLDLPEVIHAEGS